MLADAYYPGLLSKGANAPSLGAYVRSKVVLGMLGIQGAAWTGGQRIAFIKLLLAVVRF